MTVDISKERSELSQANMMLDDIHFPMPKRFSEPLLDCCDIIWLRPTAISDHPAVYAFDTGTSKAIQVERTDPIFDWLMVPLASMCMYPQLVYNLLPAKEDFSKSYAGMFKIRLYNGGKWVEILIDDRLPFHTCTDDVAPYFVATDSGYWLPLVLKAFAKCYGSYERLISGGLEDGYQVLTSGVTEVIQFNDLKPKFHVALIKYFDSGCILTLKYVYQKDVKAHTSYFVIVDLNLKHSDVSAVKPTDVLIKLKYGFSAPQEKNAMKEIQCPRLLKLLMTLNSRDNTEGAYWMSYGDLISTFTTLYACNLDWGMGNLVRSPKVKLESHKLNGAWFPMRDSTHSLHDPGSIPFWSMPQFPFELREPDLYGSDSRCEFLVSLQQPGHLYNPSVALMGFFIFRLVNESEHIPAGFKFFSKYRPLTQVIDTGNIIRRRLKLPVGAYLLVPVAEPENHNNFYLRVYTEAKYRVYVQILAYRRKQYFYILIIPYSIDSGEPGVDKNKPTSDKVSEVSSMYPKTMNNRSEVLRAKDELLKAGALYQDDLFPPFESDDEVWLRPSDLSRNPTLTINPQILDLHSQSDDNHPLVGAFASVCQNNVLVSRICPGSQSFTKHYCGLFYFQFWRFGEWAVVVIDDRLPYIPSKRKLARLRSARQDEFFFSLLEKAYAKFVGGYRSLASMKAKDILVDLTGGVSELWVLSKSDIDWFPLFEKKVERQLPVVVNAQEPSRAADGIDSKITYVLKDVVRIDLSDDNRTVRLVKMADPWGHMGRYSGDWNNEAPEWRKVPQHLREKLAPKNDRSAGAVYEFWMTFRDFMSTFTYVQFCVTSPQDMGPVGLGVKWELTTIKGQFPRYIPTVSNILHKDSTVFEAYPQYLVELTEVDKHNADGNCELLVSLLQKTPQPDQRWMTMGFSFFRMVRSREQPPLDPTFFNLTKEAARSPVSSSREIVTRLRLPPGRYVLVILTTPESKLREFLVRLYKHIRSTVIERVIEDLDEMDPSRKRMIPPSSRRSPVGPFDGPTSRENGNETHDLQSCPTTQPHKLG